MFILYTFFFGKNPIQTCPPEKVLNPGWCPNHWDLLLCWKASKPGAVVYQACFDELNGVRYDTSRK